MTVPTFAHRITIGGVVTDVFSVSATFAKGTLGTCTLTIPIPAAAQVVAGATVLVEWIEDGVAWSDPIFVGTVPALNKALTVDRAMGTLLCEDRAGRRLTFPLNEDKAFTGGAKAVAANLLAAEKHIGDETIAWYDNDPADGPFWDTTFTPSADSSFLWIAGLIHGSNSYDTDIGDKTIKTWSTARVIQGGDLIGYANLPISDEQWSSMLDYTNRANWDTFEVFIACPIVAADGDVTVRFQSGRKPGSSQRDEFEIDDVTYQTAGTQTVREMLRGLCKMCGLTTAQYDIAQVKSLTGVTINLGGNGLVNAGQIILPATEQPLAWMNRIAALFGYAVFSCPDGVVRCCQVRGAPTGTVARSFTEGVDILGLPTVAGNQRPVNAVSVDGASGNDSGGKRFAYTYHTADVDIVPHDLIPDPPGEALLRAPGGQELTSNTLCTYAGKVAEVNNTDNTTVEMEVIPTWLRPGQIIEVDSPTTGLADQTFFVTAVRFEDDESDFRVTVSGWAGASGAFGEDVDPNPSETDTEPGARRPALEWQSYRASAAVS